MEEGPDDPAITARNAHISRLQEAGQDFCFRVKQKNFVRLPEIQ